MNLDALSKDHCTTDVKKDYKKIKYRVNIDQNHKIPRIFMLLK